MQAAVLALQRSAGNQAVRRMLELPHPDRDGRPGGPLPASPAATTVERHEFSVLLEMRGRGRGTGADRGASADRPHPPRALPARDPASGDEPARDGATANASQDSRPRTIRLPVIRMAWEAHGALADIAARLDYRPSVAPWSWGPRDPRVFGDTYWCNVSVVGATGEHVDGGFKVSGTVQHQVEWWSRPKGAPGPANQADVDDATTAVVTKANYRRVAKDLEPNQSELKGRSPREQFWSSRLVAMHERFHVADAQKYGAAAVEGEIAWLRAQPEPADAELQGLMATFAKRVVGQLEKDSEGDAPEERAYADGVPHYAALAKAITAWGESSSERYQPPAD
jgi:hypothetical protein